MNADIYVASYNRYDTTMVHTLLEYCTYVVRESEADYYRARGINVLAVEDGLINSFAKVQNWIIDNAPADVACVLDDDISNFIYRLDKCVRITDKETVTAELERLCQLVVDLDVGVLGSPIAMIPYGYAAEFKLSAMIGPVRIYNRKKVKGRYLSMQFFSDTDFTLQEIMHNRIILRPDYFGTDAKLEVNKGGMNLKRNKKMQVEAAAEMEAKWGKYFRYINSRNTTNIRIDR